MKKSFLFLVISLKLLALESSTFILDNDMFWSDKWYTNGLEFTYDKYYFDRDFNKKETYILGEKIFTPTKYYSYSWSKYDRPFAGLLYFGLLKEKYKVDGTYSKQGFLVEMTGKPSLADAVQKTYHKIFFFSKPVGWDSQIENIYGLAYIREDSPFYKEWRYSSGLSLNLRPITELHLGNVMLYGTGAIRIEYGKIGNEYQYGTRYKDPMEKTLFNMDEYYIIIEPSVLVKGHDSTIEGNIWNKKSPITFDTYPYVLESKVGFYTRWKDFSFEYNFIDISTEIKNMEWTFPNHRYHSLKFNFFK